jgi:hypothetical protein
MNLPSQATAYPDWAIQKAVAALNTGMKVPDIESLLVARGLDRTTANSLVMGILEGRVRSQLDAVEAEEKRQPVQLILAGMFAALCLVVVYWKGGSAPTAWTLVCLLPGLAGIYLPEMMAWHWGSASRAAAWLWLLVFGGARVWLVWITN